MTAVEIAERLQRAIKETKSSVRQLSLQLQKMPELKYKGAARSMIHRYLKGETSPPLEFLAAAAELLDVRVQWLISGDGAMTEADETSRARQETALGRTTRPDPIGDIFRELPGLGADPAVEAMLWRLWAPLLEARRQIALLNGRNTSDDDLGREAATLIVRAVLAPLKILEALPPDPPPQIRMYIDDYIVAVAEALRVVAQRQANSVREFLYMQPKSEG